MLGRTVGVVVDGVIVGDFVGVTLGFALGVFVGTYVGFSVGAILRKQIISYKELHIDWSFTWEPMSDSCYKEKVSDWW